jgi:pimeloyl-ACP methyl ester carboxylesterase
MELQLADGGSLYYEVHGDRGPWLVFLNGAMSTTATWGALVPLVSRHHRLVLVDFRDQGRSSKLAPGYRAARHCDDLIELFDHLGLAQVDLLGVSYGGHVAMSLARRHPRRLRRLVLASITPRPTAHLVAVGAAWEAIAAFRDGAAFFSACNPLIYSRRFHERHGEALRARQRQVIGLLDAAWFDAFLRISTSAQEFDHGDELAALTMPTLLVCGTEDALTPPELMFAMADRLPDCTALAIPHAAHGMILEQPRAFAAAVLGFLALEPT